METQRRINQRQNFCPKRRVPMMTLRLTELSKARKQSLGEEEEAQDPHTELLLEIIRNFGCVST